MDQKIKTSLGTAILIIIAFTAGLFIWHYEINQSIDETQIENPLLKNKPASPIACTEEAKQCPNGSYVSRTGPNCEFALCPENTTATLNRNPTIENVMCTEDAKQCPDGSYVSRTGPNCEFAPCLRAQIMGGPCNYQSVPGSCHISSITPDGTVRFNYSANGQLSPDDIPLEKNLNGEHSDTLNILNADNVPIKSGDTIACEAQLITKGTCTPVIFRFVAPPIFNSAN
jgi:hypothetical protein